MAFNFEDHVLNECVIYFGGPPCHRCDPKQLKPIIEINLLSGSISEETFKIIFGIDRDK